MFVTMNEVKAAIMLGERVFWNSENYEVIRQLDGGYEDFFVLSRSNGNLIPLESFDYFGGFFIEGED
jgi:hypothetical protein